VSLHFWTDFHSKAFLMIHYLKLTLFSFHARSKCQCHEVKYEVEGLHIREWMGT
jgi:hypothetical protein